MSSPYVSTKDELKAYILRHLGSPVVNIELTAEQLEDAVQDALDEFIPRAYSGVQERYVPFQTIDGVQEYILPYSVFAVLDVMNSDSTAFGLGSNTAGNPFSMGQFIASDLYKPGTAKIDFLGFEMIKELTSTMDILFSKKTSFDFNSISKVLHIHAVPKVEPMMLHVYQKLDLMGTVESSGASGVTRYHEENIYNEKWIKQFSTAKAQLQWGRNLLKYTGSVLPNGGTLNADFIYNEAKDNIEKLLEALHLEFELPPDFYIG